MMHSILSSADDSALASSAWKRRTATTNARCVITAILGSGSGADEAIPPDAQRLGYSAWKGPSLNQKCVREEMVPHPAEAANLIQAAASVRDRITQRYCHLAGGLGGSPACRWIAGDRP
jgi:hypothetical protein